MYLYGMYDSSTSISLYTFCICQQFLNLLKIFYEVTIFASLKSLLKFDYLAFTSRSMIQFTYFLKRHEAKVVCFRGYNRTRIIYQSSPLPYLTVV